jgi:hypothetical protein
LRHIANLDARDDWPLLEWSQAFFASSVPHNFQPAAKFWLLLRSVTLWCIWLIKNHLVFTQNHWPYELTAQMIWSGLVEYAKAAWNKLQKMLIRMPIIAPHLFKKFDTEWGRHRLICTRHGHLISWGRHNPTEGI